MPLTLLILLAQLAWTQLSAANPASATNRTAPAAPSNNLSVLMDGDIMLGGLFSIRGRSWTSTTAFGVPRMEAMLFALHEINSARPDLLQYGSRKISLGGLLFDTCSKESSALTSALEFVKPSVSQEYSIASCLCQCQNETPSTGNKQCRKPIRGVIGPDFNRDGIQVANLLRLFAMPQISYASRDFELSDFSRFNYFARTVPSDNQLAKALADIVGHFNWTYVSLVFSAGSYGERCAHTFKEEVSKLGVCIAEMLTIGAAGRPTKEGMNRVVQNLLNNQRARVVVLCTTDHHTDMLLESAGRAGSANHLTWISATTLDKDRWPVTKSLIAEGSLSLGLPTPQVPNFNEYLASLKAGQPRPSDTDYPDFENPIFDRFVESKLGIDADYIRSDYIRSGATFVHDAVYTFAHGLEKVKNLVCQEQPPTADTKATDLFASCVKNISDFSGQQFFKILISENNSFVNTGNRTVRFTKSGDGIVPHVVYNYIRIPRTGGFEHRRVGEWDLVKGLTWDTDRSVRWRSARQPVSTCSDECGPDQRKLQPLGSNSCCWVCEH